MYQYDWTLLLGQLPALLAGLRFTAIISVLAFLLALGLGLVIVVLRLSTLRPVSWAAFVYTQASRALSSYVYILWLYFGLAAFLGLRLDPFQAAVTALTLLHGAYISEIFRGALTSVDIGQREAAMSIGLTRVGAFITIILPQAFRVALPSLMNELASIVKDSAIVGAIGVLDMMAVAQRAASVTFHNFEFLTAAAVLYFVIVVMLSRGALLLEHRLRFPT